MTPLYHRPNPATLAQLIAYDPETGELTWRPRSEAIIRNQGRRDAWNAAYAGRPAAEPSRAGSLVIEINGHRFRAGSVAWAITHGYQPEGGTYPANGNPDDLRLANLREGRPPRKPRKLSTRNTSGYAGVTHLPARGKWMARLGSTYLGCYDTAEEAAEARRIVVVTQAVGTQDD